MSTFSGRMREYREVSIDRFDRDNLTSTVFFLSHCHRDHMVGLNSQSFLNCLKSRKDVFLYMSDVSKVLLLGDNTYNFHSLIPYIRVLEKSTSTITIPCYTLNDKPKLVSVTPLPAGHCPGSVMFLFEGNEGTVLYTGDFRWEKNHAASMPALKNELGKKHIKSMYVDTTFCIPNAFHFPSRVQCVDVTVQLIEDWLKRSRSHFVYIASPTNYGHEHLQVQIYKHTKHEIHTSDWKYSMYSQIQDLAKAFTTDPNTRIHACGLKRKHQSKSRLPCGHIFDTEDEELKLLVVRPSTMWFTMTTVRSEKLVQEPDNIYQPHRVCYSFHSSYTEIKDLVSYLNPDQVFPNVIPAQEPDGQMVQARLNSFLDNKPKVESTNVHRPLGNLKRKATSTKLAPSLTDSEELFFDSPVKSKIPKISEAAEIQPPSTLEIISNGLETPKKRQNSQSQDNEEGLIPESVSPCKSDTSHVSSSYQASDDSGSEMDLCATPSKNNESEKVNDKTEHSVTNEKIDGDQHPFEEGAVSESVKSNLESLDEVTSESVHLNDEEIIRSWQDEEDALRLYISSDDDDDDDDDEEKDEKKDGDVQDEKEQVIGKEQKQQSDECLEIGDLEEKSGDGDGKGIKGKSDDNREKDGNGKGKSDNLEEKDGNGNGKGIKGKSDNLEEKGGNGNGKGIKGKSDNLEEKDGNGKDLIQKENVDKSQMEENNGTDQITEEKSNNSQGVTCVDEQVDKVTDNTPELFPDSSPDNNTSVSSIRENENDKNSDPLLTDTLDQTQRFETKNLETETNSNIGDVCALNENSHKNKTADNLLELKDKTTTDVDSSECELKSSASFKDDLDDLLAPKAKATLSENILENDDSCTNENNSFKPLVLECRTLSQEQFSQDKTEEIIDDLKDAETKLVSHDAETKLCKETNNSSDQLIASDSKSIDKESKITLNGNINNSDDDVILVDDDDSDSDDSESDALLMSCDDGEFSDSSLENENQSVISIKSNSSSSSSSPSPSILKSRNSSSGKLTSTTDFDSDSDMTIPPSQNSVSRGQDNLDDSDIEILDDVKVNEVKVDKVKVKDSEVDSKTSTSNEKKTNVKLLLVEKQKMIVTEDDVIDLTDDL